MLIVIDLRFYQNEIDIKEIYDLIGVIIIKNIEENIFYFEIYIRNIILGDIKKYNFLFLKM